jgi:hypothetical protein
VSRAGEPIVAPQPPAGTPAQAPPGAASGVAPPPMPSSAAQAAPAKGMPRGAKIALIASLSVIVLIVLAVVLFALIVGIKITPPTTVANNYVKAVNAGDFSTAFGYLTERTQKKEGRLGFQLGNTLLEGTIKEWSPASTVENGGVTKIAMSITKKYGSKTTWDMTLVKTGGKWKIDKVIPRD